MGMYTLCCSEGNSQVEDLEHRVCKAQCMALKFMVVLAQKRVERTMEDIKIQGSNKELLERAKNEFVDFANAVDELHKQCSQVNEKEKEFKNHAELN